MKARQTRGNVGYDDDDNDDDDSGDNDDNGNGNVTFIDNNDIGSVISNNDN